MLKQLILLASNIPAALIGGGIFLISLLGLNVGIPLALVMGLASYLLSGLLIFPAKPALEKERQKMLKAVLKEGNQKLDRMRSLSEKIDNRQVKQHVTKICAIAENIFEAVKQNPQNVKSAQLFSVSYLDATLKVLTKYRELSEHKAYSQDVKQSLAKAEKMLSDLQATYEKQLSTLLKDDVLDLDTELSVLEETIEIENL